MTTLFCIETECFRLEWRELSQRRSRSEVAALGHFRLRLLQQRSQLSSASWKWGPDELRHVFDAETGPALFEETEYQIYLKAVGTAETVRLQHRDPLLVRHLSVQDEGAVQHGMLNFRGQIGLSSFTVMVNGKRYATLELEVFPTKLDYRSDFYGIVADLQQFARGLVWEYLKSTVHSARVQHSTPGTSVEWLLILKDTLSSLERGVRYISNAPIRRLDPERRFCRSDRVRRVDGNIRRQILHNAGVRQPKACDKIAVPERLEASTRTPTLNTPEHRWIRFQLQWIQQTLAQMCCSVANTPEDERQKATLEELTQFRQRIDGLMTAEPIAAADGAVDGGFSSLQLLQAAGYREIHQSCRILRMALAIEGDGLQLSIKELSLLYENWVLVAVLKIIGTMAGCEPTGPLLQSSGLSLQLSRGREQIFRFMMAGSRRIEVIYNPQFQNQKAILIPQRPDILIRLLQDGWPPIQIIIDAKYRLDARPEYRQQFGSSGPPVDAINVLHRYRDAILESTVVDDIAPRLRRSIVHAAAVFPADAETCQRFRESRLWDSLDRLGIGAIPALPHDLTLLQEWLQRILRQSGWETADQVVSHAAEVHRARLKSDSRQSVLIHVLDPKNCEERFRWIRDHEKCYLRMPVRPHRHFHVNRVAFYCPRPLEKHPAIAWQAEVTSIDVVPRRELETPWASRFSEDTMMLVYRLGTVKRLARVIANSDSDQTSFRSDRWTTLLAIERAVTATEISLETDSEWQLYEGLKARGCQFRLRLDLIHREREELPRGRAWFVLDDHHAVRYDGANGFLQVVGATQRFLTLDAFFRELDGRKS